MDIRWGKIIDDFAGVVPAAAAGFSYVQLPVSTIMNLSEESFVRHKEIFLQHSIVPEVCSSPLPDDVQVTEMGFNLYVWTEYVKKAIRRITELGCTKLVWNNGRSRVLPWEGDVVGVKEQVLQFLYMLSDVAGERGITVLVEPLGPMRTNFLNTMTEVRDFLDRVGKQNLSSMISFRELSEIGLRLEDIPLFAETIKHVQLENPFEQKGKRISPFPQDGVDYLLFFDVLKKIGYNGMICLPQDADQASLEYCRGLWEES